MKSGKISLGKLCTGISMVFGTTVGAGMLGIPSLMAGVNFGSAFYVTALVWVFMAATGLLLLEVTLKMPSGANLISLSGRFLGHKGKWVAGILFLFLYYCLLVAYFSGGAPLLGEVFSLGGIYLQPWAEKLLFISLFGGVILVGARCISLVNLVLAVGMFISYGVLITLGSANIRMESLASWEFSFAAAAIPILFSAFGFHNIIPSLTSYLDKEKKILRLSILGGTFLAFVFYLAWLGLVLGSVPSSSLEEARMLGVPVTYALQSVSGNSSLYIFGQVFAFFALTTSFLGVSFSFVDFIQDGFTESKRTVSRVVCCLCTLIPPFICVLLNPSLFEKALGVAGGFGESILNGLLPVALFVKMRQSLKAQTSYSLKALLIFLVVFSLFVIGVEGYELLVK
ncbi:MAG: aromatic amino acid transport family protein [Chlamydiota bacterium]